MLQTRRLALRAVQRIRIIPQRRFESSHSEESHDSPSQNAHHPSGPVNEHLGVRLLRFPRATLLIPIKSICLSYNADTLFQQRNFFIVLTAIPVFAAAYRFSNSDPNAPPLFTRIIEAYSTYKEEWTTRNTLHTRAVEQAAYDRNLFLNEGRGAKMVDLKFPEYVFSSRRMSTALSIHVTTVCKGEGLRVE